MNSREKVYQLDEIGVIGVQEGQSARSKAYHQKKTGDAIKMLKKASKSNISTKSPSSVRS